jgi:transcriptional regulator with XRE-family HTH domain
MKERLQKLLELEQITPSRFADLIGVQRSSVSHVISGRNNPSYDFLQKTLKAFPGLKADWLMLGEGPMYEQMGRFERDLFGDIVQKDGISDQEQEQMLFEEGKEKGKLSDNENKGLNSEPVSGPETEEKSEKGQSGKKRSVVQVMVFYDDDTFMSYRPSQ